TLAKTTAPEGAAPHCRCPVAELHHKCLYYLSLLEASQQAARRALTGAAWHPALRRGPVGPADAAKREPTGANRVLRSRRLSMTQMALFELEGRINGLRTVLELVIRRLLETGDAEILSALEQHTILSDHQEDPGAIPQPALAVEGAARREIAILVERIRAGSG